MKIEESQEDAGTLENGDEDEDVAPDDSDLDDDTEPQKRRRQPRKKGSGLAGRTLSALMMAAGTLANAAQVSWTNAVRYNRTDLAEICCTPDSQLAGEVISKGGTADRYSYWNGYDLTTRKGTDALRSSLDSTRPRWVWMSPPFGPDSPMQNLNQRNDMQIQRLEKTQSHAPQPEKHHRDLCVAARGILVRRSSAGAIIDMSEPLQKWELQ